MNFAKEENKKLCEKYPFLIPRNRWTGEIVEDYDYSFTEIDNMPEGWRKRFGDELLEEIREGLIEANYLDKYRIIDIKEKYGELHWYDCGAPQKVYDAITKYSYLSNHICINCGAMPVPLIDDGWISPYCFECFKEMYKRRMIYCKNAKELTEDELKEKYHKYIIEEKLNPKRTIERHSKEKGKEEIVYDYSGTIEKLKGKNK